MPVIEAISVFLPVALLAVGLVWWQHSRAVEILNRWAKATGVELVSAQKKYLRTGPFFLQQTRGQFVFRIMVRDQTGAERAGWIRVGGWLAGVMSDKTRVIWDS